MIAYAIGDATVPRAPRVIIAHIVNNIGAFGGRGSFASALSARYLDCANAYRVWSREAGFGLGAIYVWPESPSIGIAHLCAQRGLPSARNPQPLDYAALDAALAELAKHVRVVDAPLVQMPRIGVGLARGNWMKIEPLILRHLDPIVPVVVCDPPKPAR